MKQHNFSAGPSILPIPVLQKASEAVLDLNQTGLSILEISHRSPNFVKIINEARALTKEILNIPEGYEVLFLQGGASLQFYMSALNISKLNGTGAYIDTGTWSTKAIKESEKLGDTTIIASSKNQAYKYIPKNISSNKPFDYLHFTSNNTIYGTQFHDFSKLSELANNNNAKLICDMSSDILSKKIDVELFDLIYAGAQKNIGPAGATLVIVKKNILQKNPNLPTYLNYQTHIDKESMFNTPPVFSIYVAMLTLKWIKRLGGLTAIESKNREKATTLYNEIDRNSLFSGLVEVTDRSMMNVTFKLNNENLETKFNTMCQDTGISGLNGHRSVGGYRASLYNALDIESVHVLIKIMQQLEKIS